MSKKCQKWAVMHNMSTVKNSPIMGWGGLSKKSKCQKNELSINTPIYLPIGEGVSTNHKSSNRIELSQLGEDLFNI